MLPAPNRLRSRRDFKRVYKRGYSVARPCLVLYWRKAKNKQPRIGFSVSKKLGKAVKRNLIKRRCRAAAYGLIKTLPPALDLVFVARSAAANASFGRLREDMEKAILLMKQKLYPAGRD